jgi:alpha-1,2-mannosyltransferase
LKPGSRAARGGLLAAAVAVLAFGVFMNVRFGEVTLQRISTDSMDVHADFDTFWRSAHAMWSGGEVYDAGARLANLNPPFWILLISPFGLLEPLAAYRTFVLLSIFVTVGYLAWMADELRLRAGWSVVATGLVLLSSPFLATLALGQVYPVLALGLVASWVADRRGRRVLSGVFLGLVVAVKPSLLPLALLPFVRREWGMLASMLASGAAATLLGFAMLGPDATFDWLRVLEGASLSAFWDNASIPAAAARLFTDNEFAEPVARLPWMVSVAYALGIALVFFTAWRVRHNPEGGLWAMVAAALLASPIAWHNYLVLLAPGVLLFFARGRIELGLLLLALQFIPPQWPMLWRETNTVPATLALTLYLYILVAHWFSFLTLEERPERAPAVEKDLRQTRA